MSQELLLNPVQQQQLSEKAKTTVVDANTIGFDRLSAQSFGLPNATYLRRFLLDRALFMSMPAYNGENFEVSVRPPMTPDDARALGEFCLERDIVLGVDCDLAEREDVYAAASQNTDVPETYDPGVMIVEPRRA